MAALSQEPGIAATRLEWYQIWKCLFQPTDVIHFNLQHPFKRFAASLLGRLLGLTVIHTIHGNEFDFERWSNKAAIALSDGFILLNVDIYQKFKEHTQTPFTLMTPILRAVTSEGDGELDATTTSLLNAAGQVEFAVVYAHTKDFRRAQETYGFLFVADILPQLKEMGIWVIFLDPKAAYQREELDPHNAMNLIHIQTGVNFRALLKRTLMYLRPTSTDGNSVAVLEALERGVPVVASDAVTRPRGVILYTWKDQESFLWAVGSAKQLRRETARTAQLSSSRDYLEFVNHLRDRRRARS